ncbi:MAG: hypothetical protein CMH55_01935 [Myxococcales bacterium]|nr:hypothetical protein [Myxococcales bacterium]
MLNPIGRSLLGAMLLFGSAAAWAHVGPHDGDGNDLPIPGQDQGGALTPSFTYDVLDQSQAGGPAGSFVARPAGAVSVAFGDDSVQGPFNLPFPTRFYGEIVTQFWASSNGFIAFDALNHAHCCSGRPLPYASGASLAIFGYWTDWNPSSGWYATTGEPGARVFLWTHTGREIGNQENTMTWQVQLREGSQNVDIVYSTPHQSQRAITVGVQNRLRDQATTYRYGRHTIPANTVVRFQPANQPPAFEILDGEARGQTVDVHGEYQLSFALTDPEDQAVSVRFGPEAPDGHRLQHLADGTWRLLANPGPSEPGLVQFDIIGSDGVEDVRLPVEYELTAPANEAPSIFLDAPELDSLPGDIFLLTTGEEAQIMVGSHDREDGSATIRAASALPGGLANDGGQLRWTPEENQTGEYDLTFTAEDSQGAIGRYTFTLRVRRASSAPRFTSQPPTELSVGQDLAYAIHGEDDDLGHGDVVTLHIDQGPESALIDENTVLHFTPVEAELGSVIAIVLRLQDADGQTAHQHLELTITRSEEAPRALAGLDFEADPGRIELRGNAEGAGPHQFRWTAISGPGSPLPEVVGSDQQVAWFEGKAAGAYVFHLDVTNGTHAGLPDEVTVTVRDLPPTVRIPAPPVGRVGEALNMQIEAEDPNGDPIESIEWQLLPADAGSLEGQGTEAILTGEAPGQYQVHVTVSASGGRTEAATNVVLEGQVGCGCDSRGDHSGWLLLMALLLARRRWHRAA